MIAGPTSNEANIMVLGAAEAQTAVTTFLTTTPKPTTPQLVGFLSIFTIPVTRSIAAQELVAAGADPALVSTALAQLAEQDAKLVLAQRTKFLSMLTLVSAAASAYHGYRRNDSVVWGLVWFVMGSAFPVVTPVVGLAQGFGRRKVG